MPITSFPCRYVCCVHACDQPKHCCSGVSRIAVKLAASMLVCFKATRQSSELSANAIMASDIRTAGVYLTCGSFLLRIKEADNECVQNLV